MESKTFISHLCDVSAPQVRCGTRGDRYNASRFSLARIARTMFVFDHILRSTSETPTEKRRTPPRSIRRVVINRVFYFTSDKYASGSARGSGNSMKMQMIRLKIAILIRPQMHWFNGDTPAEMQTSQIHAHPGYLLTRLVL